jgi:uncharacterized cupredoxin-like copper-binding protein
MNTHGLRVALGIATASIALGIASTAALATSAPGNLDKPFLSAPPPCDVPALPGAVVDVTLADMPGAMGGPGMMGPGMMGPSSRGEYGLGAPAHGYLWPGMRMMRLSISQTTVPAGQVSFRVVNTGALIHEVTVMPLGSDQGIGQRRIEADNKVDESASLGHVEGSCGADEGDGIVPGATGWTTITLSPGRYELICNIAGHYRAGMYALLEVTG